MTPFGRRWELRVAAVGLVAALGLGYALPAAADQLDDRKQQLQTQLDAAGGTVSDSTKKLDDALSRLKSTQDELAGVKTAAADTQDRLTAATTEDARLAGDLKAAQTALDDADGAVEAGRLALDAERPVVGEIARSQVQQQHNLMGLAVLVGTGSAAGLETRMQLSTTLTDSTQARLTRLGQLQAQLEAARSAQAQATARVATDRAAAAQSLATLKQLQATQADQQSKLAASLTANQQAESAARAELAKDNQAYQDLTAARDANAADIAARDAAARPTNSASSPAAQPTTTSATSSPSGAPTTSPSPTRSATPTPSASPTASPSSTPTAAPTSAPTVTPASTGMWRPTKGTTWQWQLSGTVDTGVDAAVYDIDGFDNSKATVATLHDKGRKAVCYIDAGSYENWRPDAGSFPSKVLGKAMDGWPGERWLDVRQLDTLKPIMDKRFQMCQDKGFDAIEADNVDGFANSTGFPISASQQIAYNRMLAALAHQRGMSIALKNTPDLVGDLVNNFDFAVVEQCYEYGECSAFTPFIKQDKAVLHVEYSGALSKFCPTTKGLGFSSMLKRLSLDAWRQVCP